MTPASLSSMKKRTREGANATTGIISTAVQSMDIVRDVLTPRRVLSVSFLPRFWPTKVCVARDREFIGRNSSWSILEYAVQPPMQSAPKKFMYDCTKMFENAVTDICRAAGSPIPNMPPRIFRSMRRDFKRTRTEESVLKSMAITSMADTSCAAMVAYATPAVPILKAITKMRSIAVLSRADTTRNRNG